MKKPKTIDEYLIWMNKNIPDAFARKYENMYETSMLEVKHKFEKTEFWTKLLQEWNEINNRYLIDTGYNLFAMKTEDIFIKPYKSVVDKTFRKNILFNEKWPEPPGESWILPSNCYFNLNDCLRSTIVVKYLDGADFILNEMLNISEEYGIDTHYDYEAKDKGYYAIHLYLYMDFEVPDENWDTKNIKVVIEIQITTQIQDTIKKLTHKYYDKLRSVPEEKGIKWQWDYKSDIFIVNYLGHMLHYMEGMIMEIRDKERK